MISNTFSEAILSAQYYFINKDNIHPDEIIKLRESVGWTGDTPERWRECIVQSLAVVGVRNTEQELVGMACLTGSVRHAVLCDLAVDPSHQRKGIGAAIMSELYKAINDIGISYVYAELASTNPFRESMIQSGFKNTGDSLFIETETHVA